MPSVSNQITIRLTILSCLPCKKPRFDELKLPAVFFKSDCPTRHVLVSFAYVGMLAVYGLSLIISTFNLRDYPP